MANLAQIAGLYTFLLFGWQTPPLDARGHRRRRRLDRRDDVDLRHRHRAVRAHAVGLLGAEIITLVLFAVVALVKVYAARAGPSVVDPSLSWFNPFAIDSTTALIGGVLLAVFIYWGWDTTVTVNEETRGRERGSGQGGGARDGHPAR